MMLVELQTVKDRLSLTDAVDDTLLIQFVELVSGRFEAFCNRRFERIANETFEFDGDKTEIVPERLPVESVASFHLKANETDGWVAQTEVEYLIRKKTVVSLESSLGVSGELGRITYNGGYVLPGTVPAAGQTALPLEIAGVCVEQVAYLYQNRNRLGIVSMSGEGGSIQQFAQLDLLPSVKEVLKKFERYVL